MCDRYIAKTFQPNEVLSGRREQSRVVPRMIASLFLWGRSFFILRLGAKSDEAHAVRPVQSRVVTRIVRPCICRDVFIVFDTGSGAE